MSQPHDETGEMDSSGNPVGAPPHRDEDEDEEARPAAQEDLRGDG
ncbi:hypothetical protein AB0F15_16205 [Amycolatopsis sp. NPDC026612]